MSLEIGSRLGPYRITGVLGAGGMGIVYRAEDSSLGRDVALKVLPADVAKDHERLARFAREARVLAALDHPNIGTIYGWESSTGTPALVLELVEGPTLRDRLIAGPLRLDEALRIARQIADAVEGAHEQGVIHRDLKPANIKIRPDGRVKVLDFGLAKAFDDPSDAGVVTAMGTTTMATKPGAAVGTPAYMSPEQARGERVTRRTDIWSFGVILFEMVAGRHPFGGGSSTEVVAQILHSPPDWGLLPSGTPAPVVRLLRKCLEKDERARLRDIGDARIELEDSGVNRAAALANGGSGAHHDLPSRRALRGASPIPMAVAALALIASSVGAYLLGARWSSPPAAPETRLSIVAPLDTRFASPPAISPDGLTIAFVAAKARAASQLWIRSLGSLTATPIQGTDDASYPFWSYDGKSVGFFANGKMKRVSIEPNATVLPVSDAPKGRGGVWLDDNTIIFAGDAQAPLKRVSAVAGVPADFTTLDTDHGEQGHRFPIALPGRTLMYFVYGATSDTSGMRLVSMDAPSTAIRFYAGMDSAQYADGFLVTTRAGHLQAQRIQLPGGELVGDLIPIANVETSSTASRGMWALGPHGTLAFMSPADPTTQLTWRDRNGRATGVLGPQGHFSSVDVSPNHRQVVAGTWDGDLSVLDAVRGTLELEIKPGGQFPVWRPDGRQIGFLGTAPPPAADATVTVMSAPVDGRGRAESMTSASIKWLWPIGWTANQQGIVWIGSNWDIWSSPVGHQELAKPFAQTGRNPEGRLSPNGEWIAYASDPSDKTQGTFQIVIQRFPEPGQRYVVSSDGRFPRWRADGKELFFLSGTQLMVASVTLGDVPVIGTPHVLFDTHLVPQRDAQGLTFRTYEYDIGDAAGTMLLMNELISEPVRTLDIVMNWKGDKK